MPPNDTLPPGLYRHGRQYRCRVYKDGRRVWRNLGHDLTQAIAQHAEIHGDRQHTMSGIIERYKRDVLPTKAPATQAQQTGQAKRLKRVFGSMHPAEIRQSHAIRYLETRDKKTAANREIALLRHIMTKCVHWDIIDANPLRGLQYRNPEGRRERDVSPAEIRTAMRHAKPRERYLIWLIYLTGLRRADALRLSKWQCKDDGLHVREGKTGKLLRITWSPSLRKVVDRALALSGSSSLFPVSSAGLDSEWQRLKHRLAALPEPFDLFQLKDIRAAHAGYIEEHGGDATRQLGHSSRALTQRHYLRKGRKITPIR
jgi:integrase